MKSMLFPLPYIIVGLIADRTALKTTPVVLPDKKKAFA